jgi:cytochrome c-type biogenesis protein
VNETGLIGAALNQAVLDGSLLLALPVAVLAGLVSFASPCVIPLVPGYLGYVTGLSGEATDLATRRRGRMLLGAALFVAGFTAVYVTMGWAAGWAGTALQAHREVLARALGVAVVVLGLVFLGLIPAWRGWSVRARPTAGLAGAPLLGLAFGLGWTACTGPTLSAIVALAGIGGDPGRGALLATAYCLGLGTPFMLAALAYRRALAAFAVLARHRLAITRFGGGMLVAVGLLLVTGVWGGLVAGMQTTITGFETVI